MDESVSCSNYGAVMFANYPDIVTAMEMADMLRIGQNEAYKLVGNGTVWSFKIGNVYKIPKVSVIDYINRGGC